MNMEIDQYNRLATALYLSGGKAVTINSLLIPDDSICNVSWSTPAPPLHPAPASRHLLHLPSPRALQDTSPGEKRFQRLTVFTSLSLYNQYTTKGDQESMPHVFTQTVWVNRTGQGVRYGTCPISLLVAILL